MNAINAIVNWATNCWVNSTLWQKLGVLYALVAIWSLTNYVIYFVKRNPRKYMKLVTGAYENGRMTVGKLTCWTVHGVGSATTYQLEYMYVIDDVKYFVTYEMMADLPNDGRKDQTNGDMLMQTLKPALILFYKEGKPENVVSKFEIFTSELCMKQIKTPKNNIWRDVNKEWVTPINLVTY